MSEGYGHDGYYPENGNEVTPPPEFGPVVETPTNEYTGGEYGLPGADNAQYSKSIAKGAGVDLNSVASGVGDVASGVADITSSVVSGAVDIASSIVSGAVSVAADVASAGVQLTVRAATASKTDDLSKFSKSNAYGYGGFYPEDGGNPLPIDTGTDLNGNNTGFTNGEIRGSLDGSKGEDLNRYSKDTGTDRMDAALENFQEDRWRDLSLEEQKQSMTELADYVADATGNKNPPKIVFRDDMKDGEYGGYNPSTNTLEINQNMLDNSAEAADTVAHEMWHAYQQQCASDPTSERGREYQEGFENYISPEYDFEGYQNQMVEAEAREFAQGFKDRLFSMQGT